MSESVLNKKVVLTATSVGRNEFKGQEKIS